MLSLKYRALSLLSRHLINISGHTLRRVGTKHGLMRLTTRADLVLEIKILVCGAALGGQMGVVDCGMKTDGRGGAHVLVGVGVEQLVKLVRLVVEIITENVVVDWAGTTDQSAVRNEVEVVLERVRAVALNEETRNRVSVLCLSASIVWTWQKADVMALGGDNDTNLGLSELGVARNEHLPKLWNFFLQNMLVLALGDTITKIVNRSWDADIWAKSVETLPVIDHWTHLFEDRLLEDLSALLLLLVLARGLWFLPVGLDDRSVLAAVLVHGHGDSGERRSGRESTWMRDIGSNHHHKVVDWRTLSWAWLAIVIRLLVRPSAVFHDWGSHSLPDSSGSDTTQLGVHLQNNVGDVLRLVLDALQRLNNLGHNAELGVADMLDALVNMGVLVFANEHNNRREVLDVLGVIEDSHVIPDSVLKTVAVCMHQLWLWDCAIVAKSLVLAVKSTDERVPLRILKTSIEDPNNPVVELTSHLEKLGVAHLPLTRGAWLLDRLLSTESKLNSGRSKNLGLGNNRVRVNLDTSLLEDWVILPIEKLNSTANSVESLIWPLNGELDHVCGLSRVELEAVALLRLQPAEFHWNQTSLARLNEWQPPVLHLVLVLVLVVVIDRDLLVWLAGSLQQKPGILRVSAFGTMISSYNFCGSSRDWTLVRAVLVESKVDNGQNLILQMLWPVVVVHKDLAGLKLSQILPGLRWVVKLISFVVMQTLVRLLLSLKLRKKSLRPSLHVDDGMVVRGGPRMHGVLDNILVGGVEHGVGDVDIDSKTSAKWVIRSWSMAKTDRAVSSLVCVDLASQTQCHSLGIRWEPGSLDLDVMGGWSLTEDMVENVDALVEGVVEIEILAAEVVLDCLHRNDSGELEGHGLLEERLSFLILPAVHLVDIEADLIFFVGIGRTLSGPGDSVSIPDPASGDRVSEFGDFGRLPEKLEIAASRFLVLKLFLAISCLGTDTLDLEAC